MRLSLSGKIHILSEEAQVLSDAILISDSVRCFTMRATMKDLLCVAGLCEHRPRGYSRSGKTVCGSERPFHMFSKCEESR